MTAALGRIAFDRLDEPERVAMAVAVGARFVRSLSPRGIRCVALEAFDLGFARRAALTPRFGRFAPCASR